MEKFTNGMKIGVILGLIAAGAIAELIAGKGIFTLLGF